MATFYLKWGDTTTLEVALKDPDTTAHDLTGDTLYLHVLLNDGTTITRTMSVTDAAGGVAEYKWVAADYTTADDKLAVGTHSMEYEAVQGTDRQTFPNDGHDTLEVAEDIADG